MKGNALSIALITSLAITPAYVQAAEFKDTHNLESKYYKDEVTYKVTSEEKLKVKVIIKVENNEVHREEITEEKLGKDIVFNLKEFLYKENSKIEVLSIDEKGGETSNIMHTGNGFGVKKSDIKEKIKAEEKTEDKKKEEDKEIEKDYSENKGGDFIAQNDNVLKVSFSETPSVKQDPGNIVKVDGSTLFDDNSLNLESKDNIVSLSDEGDKSVESEPESKESLEEESFEKEISGENSEESLEKKIEEQTEEVKVLPQTNTSSSNFIGLGLISILLSIFISKNKTKKRDVY